MPSLRSTPRSHVSRRNYDAARREDAPLPPVCAGPCAASLCARTLVPVRCAQDASFSRARGSCRGGFCIPHVLGALILLEPTAWKVDVDPRRAALCRIRDVAFRRRFLSQLLVGL